MKTNKISLRRINALTKRNFIQMIRDPLPLIFMIGLPLILLILFYLLFHSMTSQFKMSAMAPSMVAFGQAFIALFISIAISLDRSTSFLTRLFTTPMKAYEYILSYFLSYIAIGIIQAILILVVGGIFEPSLFSYHMILGIISSLPLILFYISIGILLGTLCNEKIVGGINSIVIMGQSLLSGMWFPLEGLDKGFILVMNCLPFRSASSLISNVVNYNSTIKIFDIWHPLVVLIIYLIMISTISVVVFKRKMSIK